MKKILLGTAASLFLVSANANDEACGCADTSFTGAFIGVSADFSFDKGEIESEVKDNDGDVVDGSKYGKKSKHKTAFGGSIILGYGYQHESGLYMSIFHESSFLSKAEMTYEKTIPFADREVNGVQYAFSGSNLKYSRKVYVPSFGVSFGYVVDGLGFGLRGGVSIEKVKLERGKYEFTMAGVAGEPAVAEEKSETITSPFIGAYVEYKMGSAVAFLNLDYKFSKKKNVNFALKQADGDDFSAGEYLDNEPYTQHVTHKRPSIKLSIGVKANINNLIAKFN